MPQHPAGSAPLAWIIGSESASEVQVWALSTSERHRRLLVRAGCETIRALDANEDPGDPQTPSVMIVRSDAILDERLIEGLVAAQNTILIANRGKYAGWGGAVAAHVDSAHAAEALRVLRRAAEDEQSTTPEADEPTPAATEKPGARSYRTRSASPSPAVRVRTSWATNAAVT